MKTNVNEKNYPNLSEAVAFEIDFVPLIYTYDSIAPIEYYEELCSRCGHYLQTSDYLSPKKNMKWDHGCLCSIGEYALSPEIRDGLIENFDICDDDFRPVKSKSSEIIAYQIAPRRTMLPIGDVNKVRALKPCRKCGTVQYRIYEYKNKQGEPYIYVTEEELKSIGDLARTCERFDMYLPRYMVSRRVYEYLISVNCRMRFRPVFLRNK